MIRGISRKEILSLLITILTLTFVFGFNDNQAVFVPLYWFKNLIRMFLIAGATVLIHDLAHKLIASRYGGKAEHKVWGIKRYGFSKRSELPVKFSKTKIPINSIPLGTIFAALVTFASRGLFYFTAIESYELTEDRKKRVGRRFPHITEFENSLIAFAGPLASMLFALVLQIFNSSGIFDIFITMNITYSLYHMIPISSLDGCKILFGGKYFYVFASAILVIMALIMKSLTAFQALATALIIGILVTAGVWYLANET